MQGGGLKIERLGEHHRHRPVADIDQPAIESHDDQVGRVGLLRQQVATKRQGEKDPTEQTLSLSYWWASQDTITSSTVAGASSASGDSRCFSRAGPSIDAGGTVAALLRNLCRSRFGSSISSESLDVTRASSR